MNEYMTDKEQIEVLKNWWKEYGMAILIAVVIGLGLGLGWKYWRRYEVQQADHASNIYQALAIANMKQDFKGAQRYSATLMKKYSGTPYATLGAFVWAREAVGKKDLKTALEKLTWVINNSKVTDFKQIARIRAARVLLAQNKPKVAMSMISKVDSKHFQALVDKVKGDIYTAQGQYKDAQKAYQKAKNSMLAAGIHDPILQLKSAQ